MDINFVFETINKNLSARGVDILMIGGHAVNYYGYIRATMDVDFMIASEAISLVRDQMKAAGFTNISEGENVIFFNHPKSSIRVDFLSVDTGTMATLLQHAVVTDYGGFSVKVPSLLDLISMKLFSLRNPKREERDMMDIVQLVLENKLDVASSLKPLCDRFSTNTIYQKLKKRIEEERDA